MAEYGAAVDSLQQTHVHLRTAYFFLKKPKGDWVARITLPKPTLFFGGTLSLEQVEANKFIAFLSRIPKNLKLE